MLPKVLVPRTCREAASVLPKILVPATVNCWALVLPKEALPTTARSSAVTNSNMLSPVTVKLPRVVAPETIKADWTHTSPVLAMMMSPPVPVMSLP